MKIKIKAAPKKLDKYGREIGSIDPVGGKILGNVLDILPDEDEEDYLNRLRVAMGFIPRGIKGFRTPENYPHIKTRWEKLAERKARKAEKLAKKNKRLAKGAPERKVIRVANKF